MRIRRGKAVGRIGEETQTQHLSGNRRSRVVSGGEQAPPRPVAGRDKGEREKRAACRDPESKQAVLLYNDQHPSLASFHS